jgi:acyl carrier protein
MEGMMGRQLGSEYPHLRGFAEEAPRDPVVADNVASFARAGVVARIKHVLVTVSGIPLERMVESTALEADLELDSLERIETGQALEEEFGVALSDDEVDQTCMGTIGGIADYLMTQKGVE